MQFLTSLPTHVKISAICATALTILGFLLLGIPGFLIFEGTRALLNWVSGSEIMRELQGDPAWPTFILITLSWPWSIVIGTITAWKLFPKSSTVKRISVVLLVVCISCVLISYGYSASPVN